MAGRSSKRHRARCGLGAEHLHVLAAIAAGEVVRDGQGGELRGMWMLYRLGDDEVGMTVRYLGRLGLVEKPLVGPPTLTPDGIAELQGLECPMVECAFCKIVAGLSDAETIYETADVTAFFPSEPATPGHTLVIPKRHFSDFLDAGVEDVFSSLGQATLVVSRAIKTALTPDGVNLITSAGAAATQTVYHLHVHVVPRWEDDAVGQIWPPKRPVSEARKEGWAELIRAQII